MKIGQAFPSTWLSATDLHGDTTVTIETVKMEMVGRDQDEKLVLGLRGIKPFVVNKTNAKSIQSALGSDETDDWIGKSIILYPTEVEYAGETMLGIRVRLKPQVTTAQAAPVAPTPAAPNPARDAAIAARKAFNAANPGLDAMASNKAWNDAMAAYSADRPVDWPVQRWQQFVADKFVVQDIPF